MSLKIDDLFSIKGKVALVTGGGRGIGFMMSKALVANGAKVYISSRKAADLEEAVKVLNHLGATSGGSAVGIPVDVSTDAECRKLAAELAKREDKLHLLYNNAGITWGDSFENYPEAAWQKVMAVNVASIFHMTRACLPLLKIASTPEDPARVINVASIAGMTVSKYDNTYAYSSSKAAVINLSRQLATQLTDKGVSVNCLCPGVFPSKMARFFTEDEGRKSAALSSIPMGRFGTETDMGGMAIFLGSKASAFMTGAVLAYDGGSSAGSRL